MRVETWVTRQFMNQTIIFQLPCCRSGTILWIHSRTGCRPEHNVQKKQQGNCPFFWCWVFFLHRQSDKTAIQNLKVLLRGCIRGRKPRVLIREHWCSRSEWLLTVMWGDTPTYTHDSVALKPPLAATNWTINLSHLVKKFWTTLSKFVEFEQI